MGSFCHTCGKMLKFAPVETFFLEVCLKKRLKKLINYDKIKESCMQEDLYAKAEKEI